MVDDVGHGVKRRGVMKGEGGERNAEAIGTFLRLSFIGERYKFEENICLGLFKQVSAPEIKTPTV